MDTLTDEDWDNSEFEHDNSSLEHKWQENNLLSFEEAALLTIETSENAMQEMKKHYRSVEKINSIAFHHWKRF